MTGEGRGSVTEDTFTMDMRMTQHDMGGTVMKTALTAKRLGDCAKVNFMGQGKLRPCSQSDFPARP